MNKSKRWTNEDDLYLVNNVDECSNRELAENLGRTVRSVSARLGILGVKRTSILNDNSKIYALYKGDEFITTGTIQELAEWEGVLKQTIYFYTTQAHVKRAGDNAVVVVSLDE